MLHRIAWTEAARPRAANDDDDDDGNEGDEENGGGGEGGLSTSTATPALKETVNEQGETVSLEDNRCDLIWEGVLLERAFKNFKPKSCPTDAAAKDAFGPKLASRWDIAKNWKPQEEELF